MIDKTLARLQIDDDRFDASDVDQILADGENNPAVRASYEDATRRQAFLSSMKLLRKSIKLRQRSLAERLETTQSAVSHLESGRIDPHLRTLQRYARATDRRFDFAMVDPATPVFDEKMATNLWQWVEFNMLGTLLTTIATRPAKERTLTKLAHAVRFPEELVGPILRSLVDRDWVAEIAGTSPDAPSTYNLGNRDAFTIGVSIEREQVVGVLVDLHTNIVGNAHTVPLNGDTTRENVIRAALEVISAVHHSDRSSEILGVGVSIAGVVTADKGIVHFAPDLQGTDHWSGVHLEKQIQEAVQRELDPTLRVAVENDANALAIQEYLRYRPHSVVVVLLTGAGIGLGYVTNGHVVRGANSAMGECGHVIVNPEGDWCRAGFTHRGCLETVASARAIMERLSGSDSEGASKVEDLRDGMARVNFAVDRGDASAIDVVSRAGMVVGGFLATAITLLNPERVVLYAPRELADAGYFGSARVFQDGIQQGLTSAGQGIVHDSPRPQWRVIEPEANASAAASSAMRHFLREPSRWKRSVLTGPSPDAHADATAGAAIPPVPAPIEEEEQELVGAGR